MMATRYGLIGMPWDFSASLGWPGSRYGPDAVRKSLRWFTMRLQSGYLYWLDREEVVGPLPDGLITDLGDAQLYAEDLQRSFQSIADAVASARREGYLVVGLGGDDAVTYPFFRGLYDTSEGTWGMIHLDAHLDLMDESSYQGRYSHSSGIRRITEMERFRPSALIQIGVRNFNYKTSHDYVLENGIRHISAPRFMEMGVRAVVEEALSAVQGVDHVHLALDIDVLDPGFAPGAGAFEPGGLTSRQMIDFVADVAPRCEAFSLVEVNPLVDYRDLTSAVAATLIGHFIAARTAAEGAG
jgi:agmatinase